MAVAFSGQASGTDSATLPTHAAGDLIVCFAYRDAATSFTVPGGWTELDRQQGGALSHWGGLFYKVAASSSETSGTWTNASQVLFHVYTGAEVGAWSRNTGTTLTFNFAALTFNVGDGTSWAAGFVGYRNSDTTLESPPTGMTNRSNQVTATPSSESAGHDTNGGVTGWASTNKTVTGTAGGWITYVLELKATGSGAQTITAALVTNTQTFYGATVGRGAVNVTGALTTNAQTFHGATVAASYAIAGGKFDNSQTFYQATVSPGPVTVSGALFTNAQTFYGATVEVETVTNDRGDGAHSSSSERRERRKQNSRTRNAVYQEAEESRAKALADALAAIDEPVESRPKPKKKRRPPVIAVNQPEPVIAVAPLQLPPMDLADRNAERAAVLALIAAQEDDEDEIEVLMLLSAA